MIDVVLNEYHFRSICEADKDLFITLRRESGDMDRVYEAGPDLVEITWKNVLADMSTIYLMVFKLPEEKFIAMCSFQGINNEYIQLGYDVVASCRNQGMGTEIVRRLILLAHKTFPDKQIQIRIRHDNIASQRVAEKCGGRMIGRTESPEFKALAILIEKYKCKNEFALSTYEDTTALGKGSVLIYAV